MGENVPHQNPILPLLAERRPIGGNRVIEP